MRIDESLLGRTGIVRREEWPGDAHSRKAESRRMRQRISPVCRSTCFRRRILDLLPDVKLSARGEYELQDAIQMLIDRHGEVQYVFTAGRLTLTGPDDLLAINRHYLLNGHDHPQLAPYTVGKNTHLITPLRIEEGAVIGEGCVIGPRVYIERNCRIGDNVTIKDAVILRDAYVPDGAMVVGEVIS